MDRPPFQSIVYRPTFSLSNGAAFAHAVRLAIAARSALHIVHIDEAGAETEQNRFPAVRELITQWQMPSPAHRRRRDEVQLGNFVKTALASNDVAQAVGAYAERHSCDLLVMMTHKSNWMRRIFNGSLAEATARLAHAPALFLRDGEEGFVDEDTGKIQLTRVLMPIAAEVAPMHAWGLASNIVRMLEPIAQFHVLHIGETLPTFGNLLPHVDLRRGPVVETILEVAEKSHPDLIVMATAGHQGLFDDLRGSTTRTRVARRALPGAGDTFEAAPRSILSSCLCRKLMGLTPNSCCGRCWRGCGVNPVCARWFRYLPSPMKTPAVVCGSARNSLQSGSASSIASALSCRRWALANTTQSVEIGAYVSTSCGRLSEVHCLRMLVRRSSSSRDFKVSPMTRLQRLIDASTFERLL